MVELDGMLSIVMPAYNEEKLIYQSIMKTLDIVSGFVREIELIAVNDGSKDNTKAEILRAVRKDKRVRLVTLLFCLFLPLLISPPWYYPYFRH